MRSDRFADVLALEADVARRRFEKARDALEQAGFAAARGRAG